MQFFGLTKQGGDHGGSYQNQRNKNKNGSKGKNVVHEGTYQKRKSKKGSKEKNGASMKVKKEEECFDPTLPPGVNLPMEGTYYTATWNKFTHGVDLLSQQF